MISWTPREPPNLASTTGRFVRVDPLQDGDRDALFAAIGGSENDDLWTYIGFATPDSPETLARILHSMAESQGWQTHVFRDAKSGDMLGTASYMRIRPEAGSAEVGCIIFSKRLQRTPSATESMFLMARHLFEDLGYRRYEWKCDDRNAASRRAATRFGFSFEGVFRNDLVVKGRNRDTAWFSMIDSEWARNRAAFEAWLSPENFAADGAQRQALAAIRDRLD